MVNMNKIDFSNVVFDNLTIENDGPLFEISDS
jgi:hypothetical protein